jgi:O-antigen/teichoic acid export membrane protein
MNASNRTLVNSVILYVKTGITALISIFYSRYLLAALGVENYGIYNLVGGIIGMLGFITATLSNSGTRFIARSLGENNDEKTREVFY